MTTVLFVNDEYDFAARNNVRHILHDTDAITYIKSIVELTVHSLVGKLI